MKTPSSPLLLYGTPLSQPVRAVIWLLLYKDYPFDMIPINPGSNKDNGSRSPVFLSKNPNGTIPFIEEPDTGLALGEAHAIMVYLCRKNDWHDLYPQDPILSARVDWYLHSHHRGIRDASLGIFAPNVRKDLNFQEAIIDMANAMFRRSLKSLESGWLAESQFLTGEQMTLADMAAYADIGQLQPQFSNLHDFEPFPNVRRWLHTMAQVEGHDVAHVALTELGDISAQAPDIKSIINANKRGFKVIAERVAKIKTQ